MATCSIGALFLLSACSTRNVAPVIDRQPASLGMQGTPVTRGTAPGTAAVPAPARTPSGRATVHTVKRGETLYAIALEYGQDYKDLIAWNGLTNPNLIYVDQVLRVASPDAPASPDSSQASAIVRVTPVPSAALEQRPLGPTSAIPMPLKTGPDGEKRPWSEAAMAELSRPASSAAAVVAAPGPAAAAAPLAESKSDAAADAIGWAWPVPGKVIEEFSEARNKGIDLTGRAGDPVFAAGDGRVVYSGSGLRGYGNLIIIKHSNDFLSAYAHNRALLVKEQQAIKKGQKIAEMGNSDASEVKLHFEIRFQGKPVDPMRYLPGR